MTDDEQQTRDRILAFATQVGSSETAPEETARKRGWLDGEGRPTEEGVKLLESLGDQVGTRSVYRS